MVKSIQAKFHIDFSWILLPRMRLLGGWGRCPPCAQQFGGQNRSDNAV